MKLHSEIPGKSNKPFFVHRSQALKSLCTVPSFHKFTLREPSRDAVIT